MAPTKRTKRSLQTTRVTAYRWRNMPTALRATVLRVTGLRKTEITGEDTWHVSAMLASDLYARLRRATGGRTAAAQFKRFIETGSAS